MSRSLHLPRTRSQLLAIVCSVACMVGLVAAADASAAGWLPLSPALNGTNSNVTTPRVAVDDAGNVYAAWIEGSLLEVSKRPVGGVFETPQALDANLTMVSSSNPDIAVDGAGNAVVVWTQTSQAGSATIRQARRAAIESSFGSPVTVPTQGNTDKPKLAINRAGEAVLAVATSFNSDGIVRAFLATSTADFSNASSGSFRDYDEGLSTAVFAPDVAINEVGDAVIVWRANSGSTLRIDGGYRVHGVAGFGSREGVVADVIGKHEPSAAIDSQGNAVTVWDEDSTSNGQLRAYTRLPGVGVPWSKLNDLDAPQSGGATPLASFDSDRNAVAAWAGGGDLRTSTLAPGTQFTQPPQSLGPGDKPFDLALDAGAPGATVLTWAGTGGQSSSMIRAAVRPNGGVFGSFTTLTPAGHGGDSTDVAVDPQGNAAAVWIDTNPADVNPTLVTAEYDATVPALGPVQVPGTAEAGKQVAMSATAADDWSQPSIAWSFGDGGTASGPGPTHTYATAGMYSVTVTATDAAGNTTVVTRTIDVQVPVLPDDTPTRGEDFNASTVSGRVLVSTPKGLVPRALARRAVVHGAAAIAPPRGYTRFRLLGKDDNIPVGSILDASKGISQVTMASNASSTVTQKGQFSKGVYKTSQGKSKALTTATMLGGGNFKRGCKVRRRVAATAARRRPSRQLFANVKGRFRTRGRNSTATVRGTKYLVKDSCRGTVTVVSKGSVVVRDLVKHRSRVVRTGHRYLARP